MRGLRIGIAGRGFAALLACVLTSGVVLAQVTTPIPAPATAPPDAGAPPPGAPTAPSPVPQLTRAQLDQLVAPIALYPDPLLAQILMASTYPLEVVEAARWVKAPANQALAGDALTGALAGAELGSQRQGAGAVPAGSGEYEQPAAMDRGTRQRLSRAAGRRHGRGAEPAPRSNGAGNLKQTPQCRCVIQTSGETISILPAEPQAVCVPVYSPSSTGHGPIRRIRPFPSRSRSGSPTSQGSGSALARPSNWRLSVRYGAGAGSIGGIATSPSTPARFALASGGRASFSGNVWVHDPAHRGGVGYADAATRGRFDAARASAVTAAARSGAAGSGAARGGAGRFGAMAAIHGGAAASRGEAALHGGRDPVPFHGAPAAHSRAAFRRRPRRRVPRRPGISRRRRRMAAERHISRWAARMAAG